MILVRIDRESVKKNPTAGNRIACVYLGNDVTFEGSTDYVPTWLLPYIIQEESQVISGSKGVGYHIKGRIDDPELLSQLEEYGRKQVDKGYQFTLTHHRRWQDIYSMYPEPDWLYSCVPVEITCEVCNAVNSLDDLGVNEAGDVCCCKCEASIAVDFEDINEVVKELSLV